MSLLTHSTPHTPPVEAFEAADDLELLSRFAAHGDAEAFGRIAHRHAAAVYATCLRVLGDNAAAEDAAQETFFRLLRRPNDVTRSLGAWLHRTATNVALDMRRSDTSRHRRELLCGWDASRASGGGDAGGTSHQASTWAELSPSVDQALSEMPEELRSVLVEHYLLGRTQADLAAASGQCPATICRRVKQGVQELRRRLRLKGIDALPLILAGLLCQAAARQAPAAVIEGLAKMAMIGPMDPTIPGRVVSGSAKPGIRPSISRGPMTGGQQVAAGVFCVGVSLVVLALLAAMAIGLANVASELRGVMGPSPVDHRSGD